MELVSDPFDEGDCVAVRIVSKLNPSVRTIDLPISILAGWEDLFQEQAVHAAAMQAAKASHKAPPEPSPLQP